MSDYQPTWRRPIAQAFRRTAFIPAQWCVWLGIRPNLISYSSIVTSVGAGLCFWQAGTAPALLIVAVAFCYLRLWLNMLDGMVALHVGAWITLVLLRSGDGTIHYLHLTVLDWTSFVIVLGCVQTIWIRMAKIINSLQKLEAAVADQQSSKD